MINFCHIAIHSLNGQSFVLKFKGLIQNFEKNFNWYRNSQFLVAIYIKIQKLLSMIGRD